MICTHMHYTRTASEELPVSHRPGGSETQTVVQCQRRMAIVRTSFVLMIFIQSVFTEYIYRDKEWEMYKTAFNKSYSYKEEKFRRALWESKVKLIEHHNIRAKYGKVSYSLGINMFTDMTDDEYSQYRMKPISVYDIVHEEAAVFLAPNYAAVPSFVNWTEKGYVTPVKNQGPCGSCWSFSSTGALEGQHFRKTQKLVSLSEQNLIDCVRNALGCYGGMQQNAFKYVKENSGIDTEASYPYVAKKGSCQYKSSTSGATCSGYVKIERGNETALKIAVANVGPIAVLINSNSNEFHNYKSGIFDYPECNSLILDHAVLVVGYGTENGNDYWFVKNSWGAAWGLQGYIKMSRNKNNQCGIAQSATYPTM